MAGDVDKARLWANADVYLGDDASTFPDALTAADFDWVASGWSLVGLLDGEEGFTETREQETTDHFAWGGILVRRARSQKTRTIQFVALEDNATVFELVNPGSPAPTHDATNDVTTRLIQVPQPKRIKIAFELREGIKFKQRFTETSDAELSKVDERTESETELAVYTVTVVLYPDASGNLYTELVSPALGSGGA